MKATMKMVRKALRWYLLVGLGLNLLSAIVLFFEVTVQFPENQVRWDIGLFWWITLATAGTPLGYTVLRSKWQHLAMALWLLLPVTLLMVDEFNMLIPRETWSHRGMPKWGQLTP